MLSPMLNGMDLIGIEYNKICIGSLLDRSLFGIETKDLWLSGKYARIVPARSVFCYWAVRELGLGRFPFLNSNDFNKSLLILNRNVNKSYRVE